MSALDPAPLGPRLSDRNLTAGGNDVASEYYSGSSSVRAFILLLMGWMARCSQQPMQSILR